MNSDSGNLIDPVSNMCLAGAVVACWSVTQEVAGSSSFTVITNILSLNSLNSFSGREKVSTTGRCL